MNTFLARTAETIQSTGKARMWLTKALTSAGEKRSSSGKIKLEENKTSAQDSRFSFEKASAFHDNNRGYGTWAPFAYNHMNVPVKYSCKGNGGPLQKRRMQKGKTGIKVKEREHCWHTGCSANKLMIRILNFDFSEKQLALHNSCTFGVYTVCTLQRTL